MQTDNSRCSSCIQKRQRNQRSNCQHPLDHSKSKSITENIYFCFIDYTKAFDCVDHKKIVENSSRDGNTRPPYLTPEKSVCRSGSNNQNSTLDQQTDSKLGKEHLQAVLSPCLFNLYAEYTIRNTRLDEAQAEMKIAGRNINNLRQADDTTLTAESKQELKSPLIKVKKESEKVGLKLNIQKTKIMTSGPITSWQIDGETVKTVTDFILGGSKITADGDCSHEIKRRLPLERKVMTNLDSILKSRDITLP